MSADFYVDPFSLADGRKVAVIPLTYGRARITISSPGDDFGYLDGW